MKIVMIRSWSTIFSWRRDDDDMDVGTGIQNLDGDEDSVEHYDLDDLHTFDDSEDILHHW